jgi:hypothetical protein
MKWKTNLSHSGDVFQCGCNDNEEKKNWNSTCNNKNNSPHKRLKRENEAGNLMAKKMLSLKRLHVKNTRTIPAQFKYCVSKILA